ncbi:hypothetical protein FHT17_002372 [Novosphingobium sp. SG916]|nr:hypothetical protein [Novosphingobium sp. SG919]NMN87473.1 hypothetical protein [Novosphingobium sp. SG916]
MTLKPPPLQRRGLGVVQSLEQRSLQKRPMPHILPHYRGIW